MIFVGNSFREVLINFLVIRAIDSEHQVNTEIHSARKTEPLACGAEIVVNIAVVEDVDTADEHIYVALELVDAESGGCTVTLTLVFEALVVVYRIIGGCLELLVQCFIA